ncbi:MAG TPA: ABC transporter ATP-binding protein [Acidimicrobiia bacterium]|nr:ABC transporter ATP-binding protein [Acidimicrobiia bacterium]
MTSERAISVSGLYKKYGRTQALDGLDFVVPTGQLTGFLGPNGAGKTTTFRSILGLTRPDAGEVEIFGMPVPAGLPEIVKKIGVIVEEPGLVKSLSGRVNLAVAADTLGFGHERIDGMLEFVGLTDDAERKTGDYSKGMRQRLALAAAMLGDPELLILDEPLDGLDPAGQHAFRSRLKSLAAEGRSVVVSSHDLPDVEALADHVVVIDRGRLVTQGPLEELLGGRNTRVRVADPRSAETALRTGGFAVTVDEGGLVVDTSNGAEVIETLSRAGIFPDEVRPERSTLESVFLGLTGTVIG